MSIFKRSYGPTEEQFNEEYGDGYYCATSQCTPTRASAFTSNKQQYIRLDNRQSETIQQNKSLPRWFSFRSKKANQIEANQPMQLSSGQDEIDFDVEGEVVREWIRR